jgi:hypothetical protein
MWGVLPDSDSERVALAELQQGAGTVSDTRRPSLRSNFVFIQLENADAAERAVSRFNGVQIFFFLMKCRSLEIRSHSPLCISFCESFAHGALTAFLSPFW